MSVMRHDELPIGVAAGGVELRFADVGGMTVTFYQVPQGADFRSLLKGLPEDKCQCPHWGYFLRGMLLVHGKDGDEIVRPGQAFYFAPGHVPEFLEDCEFVEFSPAAEFRKVIDHALHEAAVTAH